MFRRVEGERLSLFETNGEVVASSYRDNKSFLS